MVSIIVPNYNHILYLNKRLETIFNQSFQDFEVILLDDCSSDGSWEYLETFKKHPKVSHCIRNERNSGSPFKQWEKGMDLARFDWIWIAESDDYSDLSFLETSVNKIDQDSDLIFCKSRFIDETDSIISNENFIFEMSEFEIPSSIEVMKGKDFIRDFLSLRNFILNASSVLFKKPKGIPSNILTMKFTGDWYFWIYILENGNIKYTSSALNYFRFHLGTTRNWSGKELELVKLQENMDCFKYAFSLLNLFELLDLDFKYYYIFIRKYLKYNRKLGTLRFSVFFPNIPLVFFPKYYQYFILSFINKN